MKCKTIFEFLEKLNGVFASRFQIRDLDLGAQFPEIKNIKVLNADLHDTEGHLENIELLLDLHYQGNFHLSIDADMVLGKKGFLSIKGILNSIFDILINAKLRF